MLFTDRERRHQFSKECLMMSKESSLLLTERLVILSRWSLKHMKKGLCLFYCSSSISLLFQKSMTNLSNLAIDWEVTLRSYPSAKNRYPNAQNWRISVILSWEKRSKWMRAPSDDQPNYEKEANEMKLEQNQRRNKARLIG